MSGFWSTIAKTGQNGYRNKESNQLEEENSYLGCPKGDEKADRQTCLFSPAINQPLPAGTCPKSVKMTYEITWIYVLDLSSHLNSLYR